MSTRWENELIKEIVELRDKIYELNIENTRQRNYIKGLKQEIKEAQNA